MSAELVWHAVEVVALDYSLFTLSGDSETLEDEVFSDGNDERVSSRNGLIERLGSTLFVSSPHQNNFAMPLRVEVWSGDPPVEQDQWQLQLESSITIRAGGLSFYSPTMEFVEFDVPEGRYVARICAAGLVTEGWPGSVEPGDWWRVQLWPSAASVAPTEVQTWDGEVSDRINRPEWAEPVSAPAAPQPANPWLDLEPLLRRFNDAQYERYGEGGTGYQQQQELPPRWADYDMNVIHNALLNLIRQPTPFPDWPSETVAMLRREFVALHEALPSIPGGQLAYFQLLDEISQQALAIINANLPAGRDI